MSRLIILLLLMAPSLIGNRLAFGQALNVPVPGDSTRVLNPGCFCRFCEKFLDYNLNGQLESTELIGAKLWDGLFHVPKGQGFFYIFSDKEEKVLIRLVDSRNQTKSITLGEASTLKDKFIVYPIPTNLKPGHYIAHFWFIGSKLDCSYVFNWKVPLGAVSIFDIPPKKLDEKIIREYSVEEINWTKGSGIYFP